MTKDTTQLIKELGKDGIFAGIGAWFASNEGTFGGIAAFFLMLLSVYRFYNYVKNIKKNKGEENENN